MEGDIKQRAVRGTNPRYVAYAKAHGRTPGEMIAHDEQRYPGGKMAGFMLWLSQKWKEWAEISKVPREWWTLSDNAEWFDRWLDDQVDRTQKP